MARKQRILPEPEGKTTRLDIKTSKRNVVKLRRTGNHYKCLSLKEKFATDWSQDFTLRKIYDEATSEVSKEVLSNNPLADGLLYLIGDNGFAFTVDINNFKRVIKL